MLLKLLLLVLPASSSWLVDGPARLGEAPEGFFRLGGRALQGVAVFGQGRNLGLLRRFSRERATQRADHEILLIFQSCDTFIILALVGAQLVEVFARRAKGVFPGFGRHICAAPGTKRLESELCGQLTKLRTHRKRLLGTQWGVTCGQLEDALMRQEAASSIVCGHKTDQCREFAGRGGLVFAPSHRLL